MSRTCSNRIGPAICLALTAVCSGAQEAVVPPRAGAAEPSGLIRSARSGPWSAPSTWEGGHLPGPGARVQIRAGHTVRYDRNSDQAIRSLHLAGALTFARDRDTRLDVGLIKIQPGTDASENGFDCDAHLPALGAGPPRPTLEVGTAEQPIPAGHTARIRLVYFEGMDRQSCPAIVCCGGRMEFHGAPLSRTWVKLGATAKAGDTAVTLAEPVTGWRVGDRVIVTATQGSGAYPGGTFRPGGYRTAVDLTALPTADRQAIQSALAAKEAGYAALLCRKLTLASKGGPPGKTGPSPAASKGGSPGGFGPPPELASLVALGAAERARECNAPNKEAAEAAIAAARASLGVAAAHASAAPDAAAAQTALEKARTALTVAERSLAPGVSRREAADAGIAAARAAIAAAEAAGVRASPEQVAAARAQMESILANSRQRRRTFPVYTEERTITAIKGATLTLDRPLAQEHRGESDFRGEVANLSRNVIIESADPQRERGHTMYHRGSAGSISYAEFRHLGKEGVLGRYSLHFHLVGNTMRGSSVVGASIWDSANRWLTVHGTNYLVVRDCVGYRSVGHGFYVEDGTEVYNVFDRNLAVQAYAGYPLPKQNLPYDTNEGAGFWWANCLNSFTRNVAAECDDYGYFFEATPTAAVDLRLPVQQPDGSARKVDIRTLPFVRFEGNEAHNQLYGINLGEGVDGVGPDVRHPLRLTGTRIWNARWAFRPASPSMIVDDMRIYESRYGLFQFVEDRHAYRELVLTETESDDLPPSLQGRQPAEVRPARAGVDNPPDAGKALSSESFPQPLAPVDDLPPATVITFVGKPTAGKLVVRGTTSDNGEVKRVIVNGRDAKALAPNFAEWEITLDHSRSGSLQLTAYAEDAAGNGEKLPHQLAVVITP